MKGKNKAALLTKTSLKWLKIGITIPSFTGTIPYDWDEKENKVLFRSSYKRFLFWFIHNLLYCSYLGFTTIRWVQYCIKESASSPKAIATLYIMASYSVVIAAQYSLLKFYGQHHIWINNYLDFLKDIQENQNHSLTKLGDGNAFMAAFFYLAICVFFADVWSCWNMPDMPFVISSVLANAKSLSKLQLFPYVTIHICIWLHQWATLYFFVNTVVSYLVGLKNALSILRLGIAQGTSKLEFEPPLSSHVELQTTSVAKYFRQMEVLNVLSNELWSTTSAFVEISLIGGVILACYGVVRYDAARATHQAIIVVLLAGTVIILWGIMGELYEVSNEMLQTWKPVKRNPWFRRFLRSCKPLRVNIGQGLFFADRGIKLTLLDIITTNVASLLLSTTESKGSLN